MPDHDSDCTRSDVLSGSENEDIDNMQVYEVGPDGTLHLLSPVSVLGVGASLEPPRATPEGTERSPSRAASVSPSPSYSPLSSPTAPAQRSLRRSDSENDSDSSWKPPTKRSALRSDSDKDSDCSYSLLSSWTTAPAQSSVADSTQGGSGAGTRRGPRTRGGRGYSGSGRSYSGSGRSYSGSGRGYSGSRRSCRSRGATAAAAGVRTAWRWGDRTLQVCVNDEEVPQTLKDMADGKDARRRLREDTEDFVAEELFNGDKQPLEFHWSPMSTFRGGAEKFRVAKCGPTVNVCDAYEAFRVYWDDGLLEHIVRETNRHAVELTASSGRFARDWYDTNVHEIMILFAFWMMLAVIKMPSIKSCYSDNYLLNTKIFKLLMTEARYWYLNRALHFVDDATQTADSSKLFALGPVVEQLNAKFKQAYVLGQKITIDESLLSWEDGLSFRRIKTEAARFGIKTFELCESATGYLWSFEIYTGKDNTRQSRMLKGIEIVVRLMRPLLNKGHRLFLNSWFNSPVLARYLKRNRTDCVGILRKSRKDVPALIQLVTLQEGTCLARHCGDVVIMAYRDKKPVYTISTCHGAESVQMDCKPNRPSQYRHIPEVIVDYNASMGGVVKDQMSEPLLERKKNSKWYIKMFKRLLNASVLNSRILLDKSTPKQVRNQVFRLELVDGIIKQHLKHVPRPREGNSLRLELPPGRLVGWAHYAVKCRPTGGRRTSRMSCVWCALVEKRRRQSVYTCKTCEVPLCLEGCFEKFHTLA